VTGRAPGNFAVTAATAFSMKAGIAATGTEMSCLIEAPSRFWDSEMLSRMRQSAAACA
jgi:hypothetical protein